MITSKQIKIIKIKVNQEVTFPNRSIRPSMNEAAFSKDFSNEKDYKMNLNKLMKHKANIFRCPN